MLGLGAFGQYPFGGGPTGTVTVVSIGWYAPLSTPQRFPIGQHPSRQQFSAFNPGVSPFVATGWYVPLSEPRRFPIGLRAADQQFSAPRDINPIPASLMNSWYVPLSTPQRFPIGLKPQQQQFIAFQPAPSPFVATGWYMPLSEPQRFRIGLGSARQQFLAAPSRLLPTPNVTGRMGATETGDTFLGGGRFWNRIISGEAGIKEWKFTGGEIGIVEQPLTSGQSAVIEQAVSPSPGGAVTPIFSATVSIQAI